jgi:transcriptional regulator with XRE-family HTH domain
MEFGEMIRTARLRARLSQSRLAQLLVTPKRPEGVWATYVGQIEKGEKLPSEEICLQLAEVLGLNPVRVLLWSHRSRAETPAAQDLLQRLLVAAEDPGLTELLQEEEDGSPLPGLDDEGMRELMDAGGLGELIGALCRSGRIAAVSSLLDRLADINEKDWEALMGLVGSSAFAADQGQ